MRIASSLLLIVALLATACTKEKETPNGMKFTVIRSGDGVVAKPQQVVVFDFVMKDSKDSVWQSTLENSMPGYVFVADSSRMMTEDGMMQMFRMLSKGDSVRVTFGVGEFFREFVKSPVPIGIDSTLDISYLIGVNEILDREGFQTYMQELSVKKEEKQKVIDSEKIAKRLKENNIEAQSDSSGIRYVIHTSNGGIKPSAEDCVEVSYKGVFFEDGEEFDKNERVAFSLQGVIPGWQIAIPKLGVGDSATFYIPSSLAYGSRGYAGMIPPNSILIFDVKLLATGSSVNNSTGTCN
jgi:FKBP-type peptidyl-prolyl cis-trans isomerase FkpA